MGRAQVSEQPARPEPTLGSQTGTPKKQQLMLNSLGKAAEV